VTIAARIIEVLSELGRATKAEIVKRTGDNAESLGQYLGALKSTGCIEVVDRVKVTNRRGANWSPVYRITGKARDIPPDYDAEVHKHPADRLQTETPYQASKFASLLYAAHPKGYRDSPFSIGAVTHSRVDLNRHGPLKCGQLA
jgi:hypothetical protein